MFSAISLPPEKFDHLTEPPWVFGELKHAIHRLKSNKKGCWHRFGRRSVTIFSWGFSRNLVYSLLTHFWEKGVYRMLGIPLGLWCWQSHRGQNYQLISDQLAAFVCYTRIENVLDTTQPGEQHGFRQGYRLEEHLLTLHRWHSRRWNLFENKFYLHHNSQYTIARARPDRKHIDRLSLMIFTWKAEVLQCAVEKIVNMCRAHKFIFYITMRHDEAFQSQGLPLVTQLEPHVRDACSICKGSSCWDVEWWKHGSTETTRATRTTAENQQHQHSPLQPPITTSRGIQVQLVVLEALWNLPMSASRSEGKWAPRCMCRACRLSIMFAVCSMSFLAWQCLTTLMLRQDFL